MYPSPLLSGGSAGKDAVEILPEHLCDYQFLGHGAAGTVYRAIHSPTGMAMAVKVCNPGCTSPG